MRRVGTIAIAAALMLAPAAGGAHGGPSDVPTFFVQFDFGGGKFAGKIDAGKANCVKNRKVMLVRKKGGEKRKVGADGTNDKGKFKIGVGDPKKGKYFAQAAKKRYRNGKGDKITCLAEKSAKVSVS